MLSWSDINMNLDKRTMRRIILILFAAIAFAVALLQFDKVSAAFAGLIKVLSPLIIGLATAFVLNPMMSWFEKRVFRGIKAARALSIVLCFILLFGVLTVITLIIVPEVRDTLALLIKAFPGYVDAASKWIASTLGSFGVSLDWVNAEGIDWQKISQSVLDYLQGHSGNAMLGNVAGIAASVVGGITNVVMGFILAIYVLLQKEKVGDFCSRFVLAYFSEDAAGRMFRVSSLTADCFSKFISGQLVEAIIIGMLCFIGMTIFRFPYALVTSAIISVTALVPVFGAWIGALLGALLILMMSPMKALLFLLFIVVLQQLENNLIYPKVVGTSMGLPGLLVLVAVLVGGSAGGVAGMLLGVPVCAVVYVLLKESISVRLSKKAKKPPVKPEKQ